MTEWQPRARGLAAKLVAEQAITDPSWREAFEQVPRHRFVPRFWALNEFNAPTTLVDGADPDQRDTWLDAVYTDQFLATQWVPEGDRRIVTSSASLPTLVAAMLRLLDVRDGDRVLEIGTGTGYNTGLLCHRVGAQRVVSVDIDPVLIAEATGRLNQLDYRPSLVAGDGAAGNADGAPYDRILSTCASPGVPVAWIEQLAPDGKIVAPFTFGGALAVVVKTADDTVEGRFDGERAWFMPLRPADRPMPEGHIIDLPEAVPDDAAHHGTSDVDPEAFADPGFALWLCLHQPDARLVDIVGDDWQRTGVIVHTATNRATAEFSTVGARTCRITQDQRRLWDTVEAAWHTWQRTGRPGRDRMGLTARTDGIQRAWLDNPDSDHTWPLPV